MEERELSPSFLEAHRIPDLPQAFYYIPDFISAEEEASLLSKIYDPKAKWQTLTHRRLQVHPTALTPSNTLLLHPQTPTPSPLPPWLSQPLAPKLHALGLFTSKPVARISAPNHCLINEYTPGQGIMPHEDGAAYRPIVATVSLGSHTVLDLHDKAADAAVVRGRILQERRSLLVTVGHAYECFLHGIDGVVVDRDLRPLRASAAACARVEGVREDGAVGIANWEGLGDGAGFCSGECARETRVSLTFRDVVKVKDVSRALFGVKR